MRRATAGERPGTARLLATVLTLAALLLVLAGMHASMAGMHAMDAAPAAMSSEQHGHGIAAAHAAASSPDPSGGTGMLDCLLLGVLCVLAVVALVAAAILLAVLRRLLRPHVAARSLRSALAHLRVPDPPSPLLLSISRT